MGPGDECNKYTFIQPRGVGVGEYVVWGHADSALNMVVESNTYMYRHADTWTGGTGGQGGQDGEQQLCECPHQI